MRGLILAVQFLTRLPTPAVADYDPQALSRSAVWFPWVGMLVGGCVSLAMLLAMQISDTLAQTWLVALLGLVAWVWVTGGLHVDGLSDLADALGAAHRDPERFQAVLKDPHTGSFGVMVIVLLLLAKLILLMLWAEASLSLLALLLVPAWARWGAICWAFLLPPLASSQHGERFAWALRPSDLWWSGALLLLLCLWLMPALLWALPAIGLWLWFLHRQLGGMCGDALGAGVEVVEVLVLLAGVSVGGI